MEGFCRCCLVKYEQMELLQYSEKNRRLFVYITNIQVKRNDLFTFQLCKDCYLNMKIACNFKKQCRNTEKKIKNYVALRAAGENIDFITFLKNNDDAGAFRFPLMYGNSTPNNQQQKEDDNESICTSIRNFMTDIMQDQELPDTEARIIKEVIDEETDILDDSLESHWLNDDISVDTDFKLDFSFSPFNSPRIINNDRCYTPQKLNQFKNHETNLKSNGKNMHIARKVFEISTNKEEINDVNINFVQNNREELVKKCTIDRNIEKALRDDCNQNFSLEDILVSPMVNSESSQSPMPATKILCAEKQAREEMISKSPYDQSNCSIERELNNIFNSMHKDNFSIDHGKKKSMLLEIKQELYEIDSKKLQTSYSKDVNENMNNIAENKLNNGDIHGKNFNGELPECDTPYDNFTNNQDEEKVISGEVTKELNELKFEITKSKVLEGEIIKEVKKEDDNVKIEKLKRPKYDSVESETDSYSIKDLFCKLCEKKYDKAVALKVHLTKVHGVRVIEPRFPKICHYCGKKCVDSTGLRTHLKIHMADSGSVICDLCNMTFTHKSRLIMHLRSHYGTYNKEKMKLKQVVCEICGSKFATNYTMKMHRKRVHEKRASHVCQICNKPFFRHFELIDHMGLHTGNKLHACKICSKTFITYNSAIRHTRRVHSDERPHRCDNCGKGFITEFEKNNHKNKACFKASDRNLRNTKIIANNEKEKTEEISIEDNYTMEIEMEDLYKPTMVPIDQGQLIKISQEETDIKVDVSDFDNVSTKKSIDNKRNDESFTEELSNETEIKMKIFNLDELDEELYKPTMIPIDQGQLVKISEEEVDVSVEIDDNDNVNSIIM